MMTEINLIDVTFKEQVKELHDNLKDISPEIQKEHERLKANTLGSNIGLAMIALPPLAGIVTAKIASALNDNPTEKDFWSCDTTKVIMTELGVFVLGMIEICVNEHINKTNSVQENQKMIDAFSGYVKNIKNLLENISILDEKTEIAEVISNLILSLNKLETYKPRSYQTEHVVIVNKFALINEILNDFNRLASKLNPEVEDLEAQTNNNNNNNQQHDVHSSYISSVKNFVHGKVNSFISSWNNKPSNHGYESVPTVEKIEMRTLNT